MIYNKSSDVLTSISFFCDIDHAYLYVVCNHVFSSTTIKDKSYR